MQYFIPKKKKKTFVKSFYNLSLEGDENDI